MREQLIGKTIAEVYADSEVVYLMLADGTQVTIRGFVAVQLAPPSTARLPIPNSVIS